MIYGGLSNRDAGRWLSRQEFSLDRDDGVVHYNNIRLTVIQSWALSTEQEDVEPDGDNYGVQQQQQPQE